MRTLIVGLMLSAGVAGFGVAAWAGDPPNSPRDVLVKQSAHSVDKTMTRLENLVKNRGFTVFARIDHAAGAMKVGKKLRPTQVLIFGNPKVGTALMTSRQSAGLDLPIRVAAWQDENGGVWIGYTNPDSVAARHGIADRGKVITKINGALAKLTDEAAKAQ